MKKILLVISLCFLLTGCCRMTAEITVDSDTNSTASGTLQVSSDALSQIGFSIDNIIDLISKTGFDLKQNDFGYVFDEENHMIGINFQFDGSSYVNVTRTGQTVAVNTLPISISEFVDLDVFGESDGDYSFLKDLGAEITLVFKMPGPIKSYNKGEKIGYNKIKLDLFDGFDDVEITSYAFDPYFFMTVGIAGMAIITVVLYFTANRTKKMAASVNDHQELLK